MTDSMNFGPEWLRNLSSEGSIAGGSTGGLKYQLADHRYGREEMLALFEKGLPAPSSLTGFSSLYSEQQLTPLALLPQTDEERSWQSRTLPPGTLGRGRGSSLDRGRLSRGRGGYQSYSRPGYESGSGWGNGEHSDWSPRKDYNRTNSVDNWRRNRTGDEDEGWRSRSNNPEKWGRSTSWRDGGDNGDDRGGASERGNRGSWHEGSRGPPHRRYWGDAEDHLPEWATENPSETGGSFDSSGAFHGSDDEQKERSLPKVSKKDPSLQKSEVANDVLENTTSPPPKSTKKPPEDIPEKPKEISAKREEKPLLEEPNEEVESFSFRKKEEKSTLEPDKDPPKTDQILIDVREINSVHNTNKLDDTLRSSNRVDEDFDRIQEDLVQKLVVEEDLPNRQNVENFGPPPNLIPPAQNSWFYQDPQGDLQGPFPSSEMAEWHKAGYFNNDLLVKRQCDEGFHRLGDLVLLCGGNPFMSSKPIPPLKTEITAAKSFELLQHQLALNQANAMRNALGQNELWSNLNVLQQREFLAQHMLGQPQIPPDLRYLQQQTPPNPLLQMLNQIQQTNKLPNQSMPEKPSPQPPIDPIQLLLQQMGAGSQIPTMSAPLQPSGATRVAGLQTANNGLPPNLQVPPVGAGIPFANIPLAANATMPSVGVPHNLPPRPNPLGAVDPLASAATIENDPIKSLLRQLQNNKTQANPQNPIDSLWQSNQQFPKPTPQQQWVPSETTPIWDLQAPNVVPIATSNVPTNNVPSPDVPIFVAQQQEEERKLQKEIENSKKLKEEKEREKAREFEDLKRKKENEEKKRKEEQKKQEAEKRVMEEKRRKEEDKMRREIEKAKKEAEEKRLRELEEKRRLKEQRKAEEEARKKSDEKKQQEEKNRREMKEREEQLRKQEEKARQDINIKVAKAAPWSQANSILAAETSLAEIQRLEKEKKQELILQIQKQQQFMQEQQDNIDKIQSTMPMSWAKRPQELKKIKSLAEIQMEEQERLAKQAAETRLAHIKEKESNPILYMNSVPRKGQTWAVTASQWGPGFWDDPSIQKQSTTPIKPSAGNGAKNVTANITSQSKQANANKQSRSKVKKEEEQVMKLFGSNASGGNSGSRNNKQDEFLEWCTLTLCKLEASIDIETFVEFLRNVESALEVRDYCKEYLGDSPSTSHFASQFLEKRRQAKPKTQAQKDDMSSPAPAITPSTHPSDFQEVKGKGKKAKKSKMTKIDKSILGFSVTAAPDRINVGDRDYVDN